MMEVERSRKRRRYGAELKARILSECDATNASIAKVAMLHGVNANIVHGWRKLAREGAAEIDVAQREFVPVAIPPTPGVRARDKSIEVELRRGQLTMKIAWKHYVKVNNQDPKPFVWSKTADQILASVERFCVRISNSRH